MTDRKEAMHCEQAAAEERAKIVRFVKKIVNDLWLTGGIYDGWCADAIDGVANLIEAGEHNSEY